MSDPYEPLAESLRELLRSVGEVSGPVSSSDYRHSMAGAVGLAIDINKRRVEAEKENEWLKSRVAWVEGDLAAARTRYGILYSLLIEKGVSGTEIGDRLAESDAP